MKDLGLENFKRRFDEQIAFEPLLFAPRYYGENLDYGLEAVDWKNVAKVAGGLSIIGVILTLLSKYFGKASDNKTYSNSSISKATAAIEAAPTLEESGKTLTEVATKLDHAELTPEQLEKANAVAENIAHVAEQLGVDTAAIEAKKAKTAKDLAKLVNATSKGLHVISSDKVKKPFTAGYLLKQNPIKAVAETVTVIEDISHQLDKIEEELPKLKKVRAKIIVPKNQRRRVKEGDGDKYAGDVSGLGHESYLEPSFEDFDLGDTFLDLVQSACSEFNNDIVDGSTRGTSEIENAQENINRAEEIPNNNSPLPPALQNSLTNAITNSHLWENVNVAYDKLSALKEKVYEKLTPLLESTEKVYAELFDNDVISAFRTTALDEYLDRYSLTLQEVDDNDVERGKIAKYIHAKVQKYKSVMVQEIQRRRIAPMLGYVHRAIGFITKAHHVYHGGLEVLFMHSESIQKLTDLVTELAKLAT